MQFFYYNNAFSSETSLQLKCSDDKFSSMHVNITFKNVSHIFKCAGVLHSDDTQRGGATNPCSGLYVTDIDKTAISY